MTRQDVFEYIKERYGVEPEYSGESWNAALRVKDDTRYFCLLRETPIGGSEPSESKVVDVLSVECDNGMVDSFGNKPGFRVMSRGPKKPKWIVLQLEDITSDEDIKALIDQSYAYVLNRTEKAKKRRSKSE